MAEALVRVAEESERRFEKRLRKRLKVALLDEVADPKSITVKSTRKPSFLLEGSYLVQVEVVYTDKQRVFWCLYFDGETDADAVVEPFLDHETSIPEVIHSIDKERKPERVRIDPTTVSDYVVEFVNYEEFITYGAEKAGLLVNDLDPKSRTFGVLDWPTPLLESEKKEVESLSTHSMKVHPDTAYSLRVEACMVEGDALVWRQFRIFTDDHLDGMYDKFRKGQILRVERDPRVLVIGLPNNCRAKPGGSLGFPEMRFAADPEGWESIPLEDVRSIRSDLDRRLKPVLDPTQLEVWSRQSLAFYDLDLLRIGPANSDETRFAYIVRKPGFALPLGWTSSPIHRLNEMVEAERRSKSGDGRVIRTEKEAADYVVFFGRHMWGPLGPFVVLKSKDDNAIRQLDLTDANFNPWPHQFRSTPYQFRSTDAALAAIAPPTATEVKTPPGVPPEFKVDAWVLYGATIFETTFKVLADGSIEMMDGERMVGTFEVLADGSIGLADDKEAAAYVVFFCRHMWGPRGPFVVLQNKDDNAIRRLDLTNANFNPHRFRSIDAALAAIAAPTATEVETPGVEPAKVTAWVLYGATIFEATFEVLPDGSIEVTDDEPMVGPFTVLADGSIEMADDDEMVSPGGENNPSFPYRLKSVYRFKSVEMTDDDEDDVELVSAGGGNNTSFPHRLKSVRPPKELTPLAASELAASELENAYKQSTVVEDRVLTGQLTRETLHVRTFRRCRFRGRVNLQLLVSDRGLSFDKCVLENGLDLSGASLKGKLSIEQCLLVQGRHHKLIDTAQPFSLDDLSADGLHIDRLCSTGSLSASGVRIHGAVKVSGMMTLGGIDCTGLAAESLRLSDTYAKQDIELQKCVIKQSMDFQDVWAGKNADDSSIGLNGAVIKYNSVAFERVTLTGDLSASFLRVGTGFLLESDAGPNTIGGSIELRGANLPKLLRIRNTLVGKSITAKGVATAEVQILGGRPQVTKPNAGVKEFKRSHIGGFIDLTDADIQHDVTLVDLKVGNGLGEGTGSDASLRLRNAKVGGNVSLFLTAEDAKAQRLLHAEANAERDFAGEWQHGLDLKNAAILGDVDLSGVLCSAGGISLEEADIQRDLHIESSPARRATATHLAMTGLKCQGEADITGLELRPDLEPAAGRPHGAVIADMATFANKLIVAEVGRFATIPGRLDLSGSTIGELAVSYNSFPLEVDEEKEVDDKNLTAEDKKELDDKNLKTHGIILNRARVDRLSVFRTSSDNDRECRYPQPIDLGFAEIKWWAFREGEESESDKARDYKQILLGDHNKQRHTFSSIEQNLFNRGLDVEADDIHKAMRDWLQTQGNDTFFGRWKNRGRFLWDSVTRATTSPWRLLSVVVLSTLFSALCVFSNPANIGPSEEGLTAHREWQADRVPPNAEWGWRSGVWMALRFHVPVAVLGARSAWAPANGRELTVSLPYLSWRTARLSPEDYANIVLALHCLIWPVILIIASRKFFMRLGK